MEEKPVAPKKQSESRYDYVIAFLAIEAIALVCFGFAGTNGLIFLRAIGLCLSLFLFPFAQRMFAKQKTNKKLYYPLIPVGVTMLLLCFSLFWFKLYGSAAFTAFFDGLLVFLGLSGFFLLALGLKSIPWMKLEYILLGVLTGLALAVFITMFYSVIRYGFFYAARFKSLVYYYDGVVFHIDIIQINSYAFTYTNTGTKKQSQNSIISFGSQFLKSLLPFAHIISGLSCGKYFRHFIPCQPDNRFFMNPGEGNQFSYVGCDSLVFEQIIIKRPDRTEFPFD